MDAVWLSLGASDLRGGLDVLLALVLRAFEGGAQPHHAQVFAYRGAGRLKVLPYDGVGMWLCTRRLQEASFAWPHESTGRVTLKREQFDWIVRESPWQYAMRSLPGAISAIGGEALIMYRWWCLLTKALSRACSRGA